ncbi:MAG: phosphate signaling complex protein PhoU [Deltaproteobacteria bacterium]|nr:phosphate signaling complex protein PhoU [Deltaproteobacteria bacterium]
MHQNFHREMEKIQRDFLNLGSLVEDRVRKVCAAITSHDDEVLDHVIKSDYEIDEKEVEIEEDCLKILALYQPVARDLRFLIAMIKINSEIERIGDYAVNIAMRVRSIKHQNAMNLNFDYQAMSEKVIVMLKMSLDALVQRDVSMAHKIFIMDDEVDALRNQAYKTVTQEVGKYPDQAACLINNYLLARHLERIADRSTNIAEEVIYMVEGEIVRGDRA